MPDTILISLGTTSTPISSGVPAAPTNLKAQASGAEEIELSWSKVTNATSYYIYRSSSSTGTYSKIDTTSSTYYTDDDLNSDKTYYYKIKAYNSKGTSDYSSAVHATTDEEDGDLSAPDGLEAYACGPEQIFLTWDEEDNATSYYIYRSDSTSSGSYLKIASIAKTFYTDTSSTLEPGETYYYKIKAHNSSGTSAYSSYADATTDEEGSEGELDTPDNPEADSNGSDSISLAWDEVSGADEYFISRSATSTGTFNIVAVTSDTDYTDYDLSSGKTYYYKIMAHGSSGTSDFTSKVNATTDKD